MGLVFLPTRPCHSHPSRHSGSSCLLMQSVIYMRRPSFFFFLQSSKFILPLTLKERRHGVVYDTVIGLGLMLIDGAVWYSSAKSRLYLYTEANSDCFLPRVLGKKCRESSRRRRGSIILMPKSLAISQQEVCV